MTSPDQIRVQAHIPHEDGAQFVVDENGDMPSQIFDPSQHDTYEGTLNAIMQDVAGTYGKVATRLVEHETHTNHIVYRTQAIADGALKAASFTWKA